SAGFWNLSKVKICFIAPRQGRKHEKDNKKKSLAERLATEASDWIKGIDIFLYLDYSIIQRFPLVH
ncbi:hypothetical protein, partial [Streptococcus pneumoniae]|uniref:hypothetical protein n=1 Tax=Streptococcus pneumoniae TaxID=1313 RepID=UPI0034562CDB